MPKQPGTAAYSQISMRAHNQNTEGGVIVTSSTPRGVELEAEERVFIVGANIELPAFHQQLMALESQGGQTVRDNSGRVTFKAKGGWDLYVWIAAQMRKPPHSANLSAKDVQEFLEASTRIIQARLRAGLE